MYIVHTKRVRTDSYWRKKVIIKIKGKLAKLMVFKETTLYTKFVTVDNGQYVLYVYIIKALYGLIKASMLL